MRHAVIGDVGGHFEPLCAELERLGVDVGAALLPEDLVLVQLGDLVHRGPHSREVVGLVDALVRNNPGRWVQLVGNHETPYLLRRPGFRWEERIDRQSADLLRQWWADGLLQVAATVPSPQGEMLVTHAGLTQDFWRWDLDAPATAGEAATRLNLMGARRDNAVFRGGVMLTGRREGRAGPVWAGAVRELVPSWQGVTMPFGQVHGHTSLYVWQQRAWRVHVTEAMRATTRLNMWGCHEAVPLDGRWIVGVDPGHGVLPTPNWRAWTSDGEDDPAGWTTDA